MCIRPARRPLLAIGRTIFDLTANARGTPGELHRCRGGSRGWVGDHALLGYGHKRPDLCRLRNKRTRSDGAQAGRLQSQLFFRIRMPPELVP